MKNRLLNFIFILVSNITWSQYDTLVYCFGDEKVKISHFNTYTSIDTVWNEFHDNDAHDFYSPGIDTFKTYFVNDSLFFQLGNVEYFLGDNNAQVNDIWQPARLKRFSYSELDQVQCPGNMSLEVISVENAIVDGQTKKLFSLIDLNFLTSDTLTFLEDFGVLEGGPLFNFVIQTGCDGQISDIPFTVFHRLKVNGSDYLYSPCSISTIGINESEKVQPDVIYSEGIWEIRGDVKIIEMVLFDELGRILKTSSTNKIEDVVLEPRIRFLHVETSLGFYKFKLKPYHHD